MRKLCLGVVVCLFLAVPAQATERDALSREPGVSPSMAARDLAIQDRAKNMDEELRARLGGEYAGIWFDIRRGRFNVGVVSPEAESAATDVVNETGVPAVYVDVRYRLQELLDSQTQADTDLHDALVSGEVSTDVEVQSNSVYVNVSNQASSSVTSAAADTTRLPGVQTRTVPATETPHFTACAFPHCDRPLRGGVHIDKFGTAECTATAAAVSAAWFDHARYLVTAGHCFRYQPYDTWYARHASNGTDYPIGQRFSSYLGWPGDAALIRIDGGFWLGASPWQPQVVRWGNSASYPIYGSGWSYPGLYVCRSGAAGNYTGCGPVMSMYHDICDSDPAYRSYCPVVGMTKVATCARSGDSGSPFTAGYAVYGILSMTGCPGWAVSFYNEMKSAEHFLGFWTAGGRLN